ncbi:MAG: DUF2785 domain-containing protein [Firmicutes bacterium]|nr:DUF2785 domain-containing protein [Bacillota bacterium]
MERNKLKELLKEIKKNDFKVPEGINPFELSLEMMNYIGDLEGEFRDRLIFSTISNWIVNELKTDEVHQILDISLDDKHLFYGLGEVNDTVFTRTFSSLIVAVSIYRHRSDKYLNKEELEEIFEKFIKYYNNERDLRGYIKGNGWAHGAAHGADVLDEFARCEELGFKEMRKILEAIYKKVNVDYYSYVDEEDERMITGVVAILERNLLDESEIIDYIKRFKNVTRKGIQPEDMTLQVNRRDFLRSLYFRIVDKPKYQNITDTTKNILDEISNFRNM